MRFAKAVLALGVAVSFCVAAPLSISGTVTDSASNAAISGASVSLLHCGLSTTTNSSGAFTLSRGASAIGDRASETTSLNVPALSGKGEIRLNLQEPSRVTIATYSAQGKLIGSMEKLLAPGLHTIMPARAHSGIYLYQVALNGKTYLLQQTNIEGRTFARQQQADMSQNLAKSAASLAALFPDTIAVYSSSRGGKHVGVVDSVASGLSIKLGTCSAWTNTSTNSTAGWTDPNGYYITQDMWNASNYPVTQSMYVCSGKYWYVIANMNNSKNDGAVKTYPNVHKDVSITVSSANTISSTWAAIAPPHATGIIYDVSYDIWAQGSARTEFMIWTENCNQFPSGSKVASAVSLSGRTYDVYKTSNSTYIAFVPVNNAIYTSGTMNLLEIFKYTQTQGWFSSTGKITQIDFGIEFVSTNSANATFTVCDFSLTNN